MHKWVAPKLEILKNLPLGSQMNEYFDENYNFCNKKAGKPAFLSKIQSELLVRLK